MKRVLLLSGIQVFPPESGGNLRTASLAKSLAGLGCQVRIYSFTGRKADYKSFQRSDFHSPQPGILEYVNRSWILGFLQWATYRLGLPDLWHFLPRPLGRQFWACVESSDLVVADFPFLLRYLKKMKPGTRILNSHNLEHERWRENRFQRACLAPLVKKIEEAASKIADWVLVSNAEEKDFYSVHSVNPGNILLLPNAVAPDRFKPDPSLKVKVRRELGIEDDQKVILFAASHYGPNREAYKTLLDFDREKSNWLEGQRIVFLVVGSVAPGPHRTKTLIATGPVKSVDGYFAAADFAINPIRSGSGTNIKMAEYLLARLPTLATAFGKRGLTLKEGEDYVPLELSRISEGITLMTDLTKEASWKMAYNAYERNRHLIDIGVILQESFAPFLSRALS